jgi:hypothetical protein
MDIQKLTKRANLDGISRSSWSVNLGAGANWQTGRPEEGEA